MLKMADNDKLNWMYEGSKSSLNREEYLLGKKIDANFERLQDEEKSAGPVYKVEHEILPGSVARRNLGHMQVDLARKIKEDPLFQIRKKEDQTVQDLMDNPLKRRQLEKLRAAETESSESKIKKKVKKKKSKKDLDQKLFAKMALLLQNGSDDSDGELSDEKHSKKKKKKKKHRKDSKQKRVNRSSSRSRSRSPIKTKKAKKKSRRHSSSSSSSSNSSSPDERALDHLKGNQTLFELSRQGSSGGRSAVGTKTDTAQPPVVRGEATRDTATRNTVTVGRAVAGKRRHTPRTGTAEIGTDTALETAPSAADTAQRRALDPAAEVLSGSSGPAAPRSRAHDPGADGEEAAGHAGQRPPAGSGARRERGQVRPRAGAGGARAAGPARRRPGDVCAEADARRRRPRHRRGPAQVEPLQHPALGRRHGQEFRAPLTAAAQVSRGLSPPPLPSPPTVRTGTEVPGAGPAGSPGLNSVPATGVFCSTTCFAPSDWESNSVIGSPQTRWRQGSRPAEKYPPWTVRLFY
ncbi:pre-mRNA-splicing factor CWC25-like isoform X1 [Amphibalanus amphitrite]|uniref:pre-mRNA-splicing factor CWC25-like isoform X1 n=1 Tax=Amphibalanus amphitrite TaxID=1232801 RepID=UPI001C923E0B|nr:pre-mRNA-splicing factor CWC25-like isoform X1 [Amphibalanus amphitrite]XP_043223943.1 pre-mRNA-splicing factor CWC25-like isoform X1 [Amphibalanus amphitrite]